MFLFSIFVLITLLLFVGLLGIQQVSKSIQAKTSITWNEAVLSNPKVIGRLVQLTVIALLLAMVLGPAGLPVHMEPVNVQPVLIQIAAQSPAQTVAVIVQKVGSGSTPEEDVTRLGGIVTEELAIIHGFAARLSASAVLEIARDPGVRWVSLDAPIKSTVCAQCVDTTRLINTYISTIHANQVWNVAPYLQGRGIGVAVLDSGVNPNGDLYTNMGVNRQIGNVRFNTDYNQSTSDGFGHGTHVASIIGGDGSESNGQYIGVAPMANIINVKVSNDDGSATIQDVVRGLNWVLQNKNAYNIRIVNLSLNSSVSESYHTSPLDAAVEILWFNGIVVVTSAGNTGSGVIYPPANDPFVITIGATDDKGTNSLADDVISPFSAYGKTESGFSKPEIVAPGTNIIARIVNSNMGLAASHPSNKVYNNQYFRMSGTSMAAPMVSGAVALLLQDEPNLTPEQVKYRLMATASKNWPGYSSSKCGSGYLDIAAAVGSTTTQSANTGLAVSNLLITGTQPVNSSVSWNSVSWNSVSWNSVSWNSVSWNSVSWNSVSWNSDYWGN